MSSGIRTNSWLLLPIAQFSSAETIKDRHYKAGNAIVVHSLDELYQQLERYHTDDIYVIGGESIYRQLLDECSTAYVTKIEFAYSADAYAPNLDIMQDWELAAESEEQTYFDIIYYFRKYIKK